MPKSDPTDASTSDQPNRRRFTKEFKEEAVQMLLDGHSATSVAERLGLSGANLLHRWKRELVGQAGKTAETLDGRASDLEAELRRVRQERDILRKALAIFGRDE